MTCYRELAPHAPPSRGAEARAALTAALANDAEPSVRAEAQHALAMLDGEASA